jgi:anaerobic selenocysteine-containing dehydrogenase
MERRNFIKISALSGVMATLDSCGSPDHQLIRFIPDEDLVPGIATWKPSLCTMCGAGCGLLVRVMQGEAEVVHNGQNGLVQMGLAKKLEGNPNHPVNLGKLCARGQAGLQVLYHPDRLRNPLKRTGARGSGQFQEVTWDAALGELLAQLSALRTSDAGALAFLSRPLQGQRRELVERFLKSFGAPPAIAYEPLDEAVLRQANLLSFGHSQLPTLDLARADYLLSFGADFLGTWNSPVSQSIGYGEMRQGRPGRRGRFAQIESRMSQTGANADEWIPCRPGTEGVLALGIANVILQDKEFVHDAHSRPASLIAGWSDGLPDFTPEMVEKQTGVSAAAIARLAHDLTHSGLGAVIIGGPPLAHTNGLFNALAVNALESLVDAGRNQPALLSFTPAVPFASAAAPSAKGPQSSFAAINALSQSVLSGAAHAPKVLLLDNANPVFSAPPATHMPEAIAKIPYVASFGSFIDETSVWADLVLPDHAPLESWLDDVPAAGAVSMVAGLAPPAVRPLHNTRAMPDVILDLGHQLGGSVAAALPWKTYDEMLQAAFLPLRKHPGSIDAKDDDEFWSKVQQQGGWWSVPAANGAAGRAAANAGSGSAAPAAPAAPPGARAAAKFAEPQFDGAPNDFPFYFLPYASQALGDGSLAHLPWLQEMPDVLTTAMWSSWVELNPQTAERLKILPGELVEITSQHGSVRAPAVLSPGIAPDLVAMPIGQGHINFGRYASHRGANPLAILAPLTEAETGSLAWAATRVKLARVGGVDQANLILYAGGMSGFPHEEEPHR